MTMNDFDALRASYVDVPMPVLAQTIALAIGGIAVTAFLIIACWQARRYRSALPPLFLLAGFSTVALEPIVDVLGHGFHPLVGQITLFSALNRSIPVHIALVYTFYYASMYILLFPRMLQGGLSTGLIWKIFWTTVMAAFIFEIIPLQAGLWFYFDRQALWIWRGGMPIFWIFTNTVSILVPLTLIKLYLPKLSGWRQILVIPLSPVGAIMGHLGTGFPFYIASNSKAEQWLVDVAGIASLGLVLLITGLCAHLLAQPATPSGNPAN